MATTPVYALPYQTLTDQPDGPSLGEDLALAVEAELVRIDGDVSGIDTRVTTLEATTLLVASDYKSSGDVTVAAGASTLVHSLTFTAVSGEVYTFRWMGSLQGQTSGSQALLQGRHAAGASVTCASTSTGQSRLYVVNGNNHWTPWILEDEFTASASGTYTVGLCLVFFSGSNNIVLAANANDQSCVKVLRTTL